MSSTIREDRTRLKPSNERSIIASVYTRIATDVAAIPLKHVRVDSNDRYKGTINSGLNTCLSLEANIDQTGREFILDAVLSMFDEGHVALVPIETQDNLLTTSSIDILSMRVGKVTQWFPRYVRVEVYNDNIGKKQEITLPKDKVAIIENPFYSVMNEPNSTLRRLNHKLNLLDVIDDQTSSGKLDLIIQLPYVIKTEQRRQEAEKRRKQIEEQLAGTKYGIAYTDGSERVTQLNRSLENNLMSQIEYLTSMLYSQLGLTKSVFDGTADEATQLNYYNSTIEPILSAFADEMKRKFLTKTARTQGQSILFIRDPFRLVSMDKIADIADKFTRNEILSTNDIRSIIGMQPVDDPRADELRNKNLNASDAQLQNPMYTTGEESSDTSGYSQGVEQDQGDGQYDLLSQLGLR
jgi:hypothetical protein